MTLLQSIILGIIQGLTEFLPISSSAHLVIAPYLLNWHIPAQDAFIFDVLVQLGTLLAVIVYFRKDLYRSSSLSSSGLVHRKPFSDPHGSPWLVPGAGNHPGGDCGFRFQRSGGERLFQPPCSRVTSYWVPLLLLVTAELVGKRSRQIESITWLDALVGRIIPGYLPSAWHFTLRFNHLWWDDPQSGPSIRGTLLIFNVRPGYDWCWGFGNPGFTQNT